MSLHTRQQSSSDRKDSINCTQELDSVDTAISGPPLRPEYYIKRTYLRWLDSDPLPRRSREYRLPERTAPPEVSNPSDDDSQEDDSIISARTTQIVKKLSREVEEHARHTRTLETKWSDIFEKIEELAMAQQLLRIESDAKIALLSATCDELCDIIDAKGQGSKGGKPQKDTPKRQPRTREDYIAETKTAPHFREYAEDADHKDFGYKLGKDENRCRLGLPQEEAKILRDADGDDMTNKLCSKHRGANGGKGGFREAEELCEVDQGRLWNPYSCKTERK